MKKTKSFEEMTLQEIEMSGNTEQLEKYHQELKELSRNQLSRRLIDQYYGDSLMEITQALERAQFEYNMKHESEDLFPGEVVEVYPGIRYQRAKHEITCDFSGARICKGSLYISYRPMVKNIENGETYVLAKTIKVENGREWDLPIDIHGLEALNRRMINYENHDGEDGIQYDHLYYRMGGELDFKRLNRRKKYENSNRK